MDDYWRLEMEALMPPNNGGNTTADIPTTNEERFRLVDQMIAAFRNTENICDSRADTHGHIRFVEEELTDKSAERMAWKLLAETQACEGTEGDLLSIPETRIVRAKFKDFTTRWRIIVAVFTCCKAAVSNLFQPSIVERFVNNPITELDTKLSNLHTNQIKAHNAKIATAVKEHGSASFDRETGELRDSDGTVLNVLPRPQKRRLADVLPPDLIQHAKVKRVRRTRRQAQAPANNQHNAHDNPNGDNDPNGDNEHRSDEHHSKNEHHSDDEYYSDSHYQSDSEHDGESDAQSANQFDERAATPSAQQFHGASDYSVEEQDFISNMIDHEFAHTADVGASPIELQGGASHQEQFLPSSNQTASFPSNDSVAHHNGSQVGGLAGVGPSLTLSEDFVVGQQASPTTRSANGADLALNHPGDQHFSVEGEIYEI